MSEKIIKYLKKEIDTLELKIKQELNKMKTIDKVRVFYFEGLYEAFLNEKGLENNDDSAETFENELRKHNLAFDEEYAIGYEIEELYGYESESYISKLEYYREGDCIEIKTVYDQYGSISIPWEYIYNNIKDTEQHSNSYFKSEEIEKLLLGEVDYDTFTKNIANQYAIDYIKAFVLVDIQNRINAMTVDNLGWK